MGDYEQLVLGMEAEMEDNARLIERFYEAFAQKDHQTMASSYAPQATFGDPVFRDLDHARTIAMWKMFCTGSKDLAVTSSEIQGTPTGGRARWDAHYTFPKTGRKVHNIIHASFDIEGGRIVRHEDRFDFYRWTRMALGPTGTALGWSPLVQNKVRQTAASQLEKFMAAEDPSKP